MIWQLRLSPPVAEVAPRPAAGSSRLSELLSDRGRDGYAFAEEPRTFDFPADHGPHAEFRNEWWYVTGNLDDPAGRRFGFELTIFRFLLAPQDTMPVDPASAWRSNQVYIGHFAITDVAGRGFHVAERFARGGVGLAGAAAHPFHVWVEDWSIAAAGTGGTSAWRLQAADGGNRLSLTLTPQRPPVLNGVDGLSQKAAEPGNASYYYSVTRLEAQGSLEIADASFTVSGLAWLDREWGSSALSREQAGWDWFALQLSDGSDLMLYDLRRTDGGRDAYSAGTLTLADGSSTSLAADDFRITVLDTWQSPLGGQYPVSWRVTVPDHGVDVRVEPVLDAQELVTVVRYWEGAVDVSGEHAGAAVSGRGYVELTGYADADRR